METPTKEYMTRKEVADFFASRNIPITYGTLNKHAIDIPFYRFGKYACYKTEDVLAWIEAQKLEVVTVEE